MTPTQTLMAVRRGALILMIPVGAELLYYAYHSFSRAWRFPFGEPERWNTHRWVDPGTVIETGPRLSYFLLWSGVILASMMCFLVGLHLLNRVRKGQIFDEATARALRVLGLALVFALAFDQVFQAVDPYLITRFNADGPMPLRWAYDPSDYKAILLGMVLYLCGWVMPKGIQVEQENRGFV